MTMDFSRFSCQSCGNCCRLPGYVRLSDREIRNISQFLVMTTDNFIEEYTCLAEKPRLSLKERPDHACVFLENNRCAIYPVRPQVCRNYPHLWRREETEATCEGMKQLITQQRSPV